MSDNDLTPVGATPESPEPAAPPAGDQPATDASIDLAKGLPMFAKADPEALEEEKAQLREISTRGFFGRCAGYWSKTGPGFLQSAMTLGGGSAGASLFLGAYLKYEFL